MHAHTSASHFVTRPQRFAAARPVERTVCAPRGTAPHVMGAPAAAAAQAKPAVSKHPGRLARVTIKLRHALTPTTVKHALPASLRAFVRGLAHPAGPVRRKGGRPVDWADSPRAQDDGFDGAYWGKQHRRSLEQAELMLRSLSAKSSPDRMPSNGDPADSASPLTPGCSAEQPPDALLPELPAAVPVQPRAVTAPVYAAPRPSCRPRFRDTPPLSNIFEPPEEHSARCSADDRV